MLETLLKIGQWQSQGKSEWDRFLEYPIAETEDKRGNPITNYSLPIIFDLDNQEVIIDRENLEEFDEDKIIQTLPLKIKGGNNKAIYTSVPGKKITQIFKTFFGKEDNETAETGELEEAILKFDPKLLEEDFKKLLDQIFLLKKNFLEQTMSDTKNEVDIKSIENRFELNRDEKLIFLVVYLKSTEFGYDLPTAFSEIPEYKVFVDQLFFGKKGSPKAKTKKTFKLCYASGENAENVSELQIDSRFGLNKMFVTTTHNYAAEFNKKKFNRNYQVDIQNQKYLDVASEYLLKKGYVIRIANVEHVIIPEFQASSKIDLDLALEGIQRKSDLLFKRSLSKLKLFSDSIQDELERNEIFWINFLAFDTDRKGYFKTTEVIKDISSFHFHLLLNTFFHCFDPYKTRVIF